MSLRRLPSVALAAWAVGLLLCPGVFIVGGALADFSASFGLVLLPPLLAGCAFLLGRYLARPAATETRSALRHALEAGSWLVVLTFLYLISRAHLLVGYERFGAVCTYSLAAAAAAGPLLLLRQTRLEMRVARLPRALALLLLLLAGVAIVAAISYLAAPASFIGQGPEPILNSWARAYNPPGCCRVHLGGA